MYNQCFNEYLYRTLSLSSKEDNQPYIETHLDISKHVLKVIGLVAKGNVIQNIFFHSVKVGIPHKGYPTKYINNINTNDFMFYNFQEGMTDS